MARSSAAAGTTAAPSDTSTMTTIWLGLPGDLVGAEGDQVDHYCTRIGGLPVFPGSTVPSLPSQTLAPAAAAASGSSSSSTAAAPKCSVCGASLSLVLQAYAPLPQLPHRALMLFGCTTKGCGRTADCWQALRCQLAAAPEPQQPSAARGGATVSASADSSAATAATTTAAGTGFDSLDAGFGDWDDFTTPGAGDAAAADTFDFSALTASLATTAKQQQEHQQQQQKLKQQQGGGKHKQQQQQQRQQQQAPELGDGQQVAAGSCRGVAGPPLPEYYVVSDVEPDAAKSKAISSRELQHVQQLLAAYEEAAAEPRLAASASGSHRQAPAAAAAAGGGAVAEGEAGASWAGEEYEQDSVSCMERAYFKFMKRLARSPQQCVRYCHGGRLLWPQKQVPAPRPCPRCGGARVFELQLMPPLLSVTLEAAGMAREQGLRVHAAVVNAVGNWDWCTIAVFSCAASCGSGSRPAPDGRCAVALEEVLLVREAECEAAAAAAPRQAGLSGGGGGPDEGDEEEEQLG